MFSSKVAKIFGDCSGYYENITFLVKTVVATFGLLSKKIGLLFSTSGHTGRPVVPRDVESVKQVFGADFIKSSFLISGPWRVDQSFFYLVHSKKINSNPERKFLEIE